VSGGSNNAADAAAAAEQQRQAAIARTQSRVNAVFNDPKREADIQDFMGAYRTLQTGDLDKRKAETDRNLRFALARGGLIGGSTQRDQQAEFGRDYSRELLNVEQRTLGAGADMRAADQDARARLISLATSGLDATTGAQQAAAAMRSNLEAGRSAAQAASVGDAFSRFNKFYSDSRESAERRRADQNAGWLYQPMGYGGGKP